ncbi:1-acyl-sn-glycerol-3-phosphate acyltransferase [Desulfovibrio mangrovi]|uniref:lysophospholipid acyltransferase family protein n=1 Tax=Desulfovibrio mangrovi TaxID=2976983 RepID=UPI0022468A33|nr:lysophospholipid acyltransferase family protein [Desulfovibrio mangrovi]UZP68320.1 1-acyl-sn-glycerol-3-phosphate acyltransferase [Desulfovibrio mangrovi]
MAAYPVMYGNTYHTPENASNPIARILPNLFFYPSMLATVGWASRLAKLDKLTPEAWVNSSLGIIRAFERVGVTFHFENLQAFAQLNTPCVFVGNHMSTLETFVLPALIQPYRNVTFVVKQSLMEYPFFRWIMHSRDPIAVGRTNPREDLRAVLDGGIQRLEKGISVVVFPQATRSVELDPAHFNSIGIKLAKKAGVPVVPLALKTDTWGVGALIKDFGPVNPAIPVRMRFGNPISIEGNGKAEHQHVCDFIANALKEWA